MKKRGFEQAAKGHVEQRVTLIHSNCFLLYTDAKGLLSEREVTFRKLIEKGEHVSALALCRQNKGVRLFNLRQIEALIDLDTGRGYADAFLYFQGFVGRKLGQKEARRSGLFGQTTAFPTGQLCKRFRLLREKMDALGFRLD